MEMGAERDRLATAITMGNRMPEAMYRISFINAKP